MAAAGERIEPARAPFRPLAWKAPDISVDRRADGSILLWSNCPLGEGPRSIVHLLADRAKMHPDRAFIRQRPGPDAAWRTLSYGDALRGAESIAQRLLELSMTQDDAVLILSGNSIEHALVTLGCYAAGVPVAPVSAAFSLASTDHAKLLHCAAILKPRMVFAESGARYAGALAALRASYPGLIVVAADAADADTIKLSDLIATEPDMARICDTRDRVGSQTIAKYLFTSGSTGVPKAVPQTHGMMGATIAQLEGLEIDGYAEEPGFVPETLEWMPWSHLSAGNIGFNGVLWTGGTLYLDEGKPVSGLFDTTIRNLHDVAPVVFASAPIAFGMLADAMERDPDLRRSFFRNLRYMAYGGATLSDDVYHRLQALAVAETGHRIPLTTMYGSTETQGVTMTHWITERAGLVGLPLPGIVLKLVPNGAKLEVRAKGPTMASGYAGDPVKSAAAFDEEGFYMLGDAVRFVDEHDPAQGLIFDGRVTEDFKLDSGTWVSVGVLRPAIVAACSPLVQDAVIVGQDRPFVGALLWPSAIAWDRFRDEDGGLELGALGEALREQLAAHNRGQGSSRRVARFAILTTPPSLDAGEITDKGYVNQRAAIELRPAVIEQLYGPAPSLGVVTVWPDREGHLAGRR